MQHGDPLLERALGGPAVVDRLFVAEDEKRYPVYGFSSIRLMPGMESSLSLMSVPPVASGSAAVAAPAVLKVPMSTVSASSHLSALRMRTPL
ncbi:hypothetical protein SHKM778_80840 [Streptomyces sp. KM77-8]|uniref:Uncharacterized protein n=1 Tax=Streptomyces haneummycinicus TaxID=3074435 RepID=A0AAT9HWD0_9ACTN